MKLHPEVIKYRKQFAIKGGKARWANVSPADRSKAMKLARKAGIEKKKREWKEQFNDD